MDISSTTKLLLASGVTLLCARLVLAVGPADQCEAAKLKIAGRYGACRTKAEARAVKTGATVDYSQCDSRYTRTWGRAEAAGGGSCPTSGDEARIQSQVAADTARLGLALSGQRFVDNGDGTVTDSQTGLMWEKKTDDGSVHDTDNLYTWTIGVDEPNGTAFTEFLGTLNDCQSPPDGSTITGGFAGHCDWRLPTVVELQTILLSPFPCATSPCIDPVFGPTTAFYYWSSTSLSVAPFDAWYVLFHNGNALYELKGGNFSVRAVRGGA